MDQYNTVVPIRIVRLIYGFTNQSLSPGENQELDDWINLSDDNMEIFDVLSDNFELDKSGISWRIAALIRGFKKRRLTLKEYEELDDWVNLSDDNLKLFVAMTEGDKSNTIYLPVKKPGMLQRLINWIKEKC